MTPYWIGLLAGIFIGSWIGFIFCGLLILAKGADKQMEKGREALCHKKQDIS